MFFRKDERCAILGNAESVLSRGLDESNLFTARDHRQGAISEPFDFIVMMKFSLL